MDEGKSSASIAQRKTTSARHFPQYLAAFTVSIGAFGQGTVLAWSSPAGLPLMDGAMGFPVDSEQLSWTGALMPLGAVVVMAPMGWAIDRLGRKNTMLLLVVPFLVGWALIMWSTSVGMLYAGRFLTGMAGGAFSVSGPVYTAEVAQKEIRGLLGSFYQVLLTFGVLFTFAVGSVLSPFWLSAVCAAVPVLFAVTFVFMPETPVYFLRNDQGERARQSLRWLRGPAVDLEPELQELQLAVDEERKNQASLRDAFKTLGAKKGLLVSAGLLVFQQLSGVNSATFYTTVIFKDAGSKMAPTQATIIIGAVQVVTTIVSCLVVDRLGRRILLLTSDLVMSLCMFALGTFFYLQHVGHDTSALTWLPVTSLSVFFVAYSLGYGPVPWLMMGELFLPNIKGIASSISCLLNWTLAFLVTKFFANLVAAFGTYTTFWIFAVLSAFGVLFVYFVVPETKGKPVDLIFREMNGDLVASPDFPLKDRDTVQGMRGASAVYM